MARAPSWPIFLGLPAFVVLMRAQTFGNPALGFDEQFYLLVGDRMLQGAVPYVDIFDRKPIGLFLIYEAIRALGGAGFAQYQIVACGFVALTAILIYRAALLSAGGFAAAAAACLYIVWLNLMGGEGGQAELFYNLPMLMAAMLVWRATRPDTPIVGLGCAAMLLAGIAMQIKYTALFEAMFFGSTLMWAQRRAQRGLAGPALLWIGCALLPTALAMLAYWRIGALQPFLFANFVSIFARPADPFSAQIAGLLKLAASLAPLVIFAGLSYRRDLAKFPYLWLGAALAGVLLFGSFLSPHYGMPVLVPACIAAAPFLADRRLIGCAVLAIAAIAGQFGIAHSEFQKGGRGQAFAVARAAQPSHGCIYVYDGYPALYMLTHSCLPTRWPFPGHLNTLDEASPEALGVDPTIEVARILASKPEAIVDDAPAYSLGNPETRALVEAALASDYHLAADIPTGTSRHRLVYRRNGE